MALKFCANLSFMFQEAPTLIERYTLARKAGFLAVECANPYDYGISNIVKAKDDAGVKQILINTPVNIAERQFGFAALGPKYQTEFVAGINKSIQYAEALKCPMIHIMSGIVNEPNEDNIKYFIDNLNSVKSLLEKSSITGVIEPINPYSLPNYYLNNYDTALKIIEEVNSPNIRLQLDIFHLQLIKGDLFHSIEKLLPYTNHIQIAQVPDRHEPNTTGEINYQYILNLLQKKKYDGYIGLEYNPIGSTVDGLYWIEQFGFTLKN